MLLDGTLAPGLQKNRSSSIAYSIASGWMLIFPPLTTMQRTLRSCHHAFIWILNSCNGNIKLQEMLIKYRGGVQRLTSTGALAGWIRPPSHGDKSRRSPGPEKEEHTYFSLLIREVIDRKLTGSSHTKQTVSTHSSANFNSKLSRVWTSAQIKYDLMSLCTLEVD